MAHGTGLRKGKSFLAGVLRAGSTVFYVIVFYHMVFKPDHLVLFCGYGGCGGVCGNYKENKEEVNYGIRENEAVYGK